MTRSENRFFCRARQKPTKQNLAEQRSLHRELHLRPLLYSTYICVCMGTRMHVMYIRMCKHFNERDEKQGEQRVLQRTVSA